MSLLFSILAVIGGGNSAQAALTCTLDRSATHSPSNNVVRATGTFTVDTIGTGLIAANFTAWDVTVTLNGNTGIARTSTDGVSTLDFFGSSNNKAPTIISTASDLTITLATIDSTWLDGSASPFVSDASRFCVRATADGCANSDPSYALEAKKGELGNSTGELLRYNGFTGNQVWTTMTNPVSITMNCTCATDANVTCPNIIQQQPISVSIDLMSNAKPEISTEEIELK